MIRQPATRGLVPSIIRRCGLSLGSNLGDRRLLMKMASQAVELLADFSQPVLKSSIYETEPVGCAAGSPGFLNAVMEIGFFGEPDSLMPRLRAVEAALGRPAERTQNDPRPIDLDLLYADDLVIRGQELELPHPRLSERRFVLVPLAEIRPFLRLPGHELNVGQLLDALPPGGPAVELFSRDW